MNTAIQKQARLEHANALIEIIASHGRRFFWHKGSSRVAGDASSSAGRVAKLTLLRGRVYHIDEYSGKAIYTHRAGFGNDWRGFSHGGTLRSLVEDMRDYIMTGTPIARETIVIRQLASKGLEGNIWGYDVAAATAVREAAYKLPIISPN